MENKLNYENIDKARRLLGLKSEATLSEIKSAYNKLSLKYHPDRCKEEDKKKCEEKFKEILKAYKTIQKYCEIHKFSFKEDKVEKVSPQEKYKNHMKRFYEDWWF
ncbi:MAG: DnaJ domain-containing protein [Elusimicrobia bacterium]|jgi:DnaJ-class molecular chaperone|nr:DnaJ domain-containing protein [Elusimicrobiota bacterium]